MARGPWGGRSSSVPRVAPAAAPAPAPASGEPAGTRHFPCSSCGNDLRFAPGQTELVCPYCGHVEQIAAAPQAAVRRSLAELPLRAALEERLSGEDVEDVRVTHCPNCGAEVTLAPNVQADRCPFCDTPVVMGDTQRQIRPQAVVPFVLSEDQARGEMTKWLGSLWFAPNGLQDYARKGRRLSGVYVPYFTFDAATFTRYQGLRGIAYTEMQVVTVMVDGRPQQRQQPVQRIRWTPVAGQVSRRFDDVLVMASTGLPRRQADELTPWDLGALKPFSADYLAGFRAETYTVELAEAHAIARSSMDAVIQGDVRADIGGDAQQIQGMDTEAEDETFKHVLLPVWTAAYKYAGRSFTFVVNGQTGEVQGERPYSAWKIAIAIVLGLILAVLAFWLAENAGLIDTGGYGGYRGGFGAAAQHATARPG